MTILKTIHLLKKESVFEKKQRFFTVRTIIYLIRGKFDLYGTKLDENQKLVIMDSY